MVESLWGNKAGHKRVLANQTLVGSHQLYYIAKKVFTDLFYFIFLFPIV